MFLKYCVAIALCLFVLTTNAQKNDSLFVTYNTDGWAINHKVKQGETLPMLARRYNVPAAVIAAANGISNRNGKISAPVLYVPVASYNMIKNKPVLLSDYRPLYYTLKNGEGLADVSRYAAVQQNTLQQWNGLKNTPVHDGQVVVVGWVLYDATQMPENVSTYEKHNIIVTQPVSTVTTKDGVTKTYVMPPPPDTAKHLSEIEMQYMRQTNNEAYITTEKGPAVFYEAAGHSSTMYYAFHNSIPHGTIIKVFNPGNGKTIFAKVIGPMPDTKQYYNCIIGISSNAKAALGANTSKLWCDLKFAGV